MTEAVVSPAHTPADETATTVERRRSVVRFIAELTCLLCGRAQGVLEAAIWPPTGPVRLHALPGGTPVRLDASGRLHCSTCGGSVVATEVTRRRVWIELPLDWAADRPRRGRPPKWLVAQREANSVG